MSSCPSWFKVPLPFPIPLAAVVKIDHPRILRHLARFPPKRDERFKDASRRIVDTWVIKNDALKELIAGVWERPELRSPIERFIETLEPDIKAIANMILLDDKRKGLNPDLARVLRRKLLREDEDWVLLELVDDPDHKPFDVLVGFDGGVR